MIWSDVSKAALILATFILLVAFTLSGAQTNSDQPRTLTVGETVERELRAGETHRYKIDLKAGEYLNALLDQHGIDVLLKQGPARADLAGAENLASTLKRFPCDPAKPLAHPYYWAPFILIGNWK